MEDRGAQGVRNIKKELEKAMEDGGATEQVLDLLCALEQLSLSAQLIKDMKLGNLLSNVNKKFKEGSPQLGEKVKSILTSYKKILTASTSALGAKQPAPAAAAAAPTSSKVEPAPPAPETTSNSTEGVAAIKPVASEPSGFASASSLTKEIGFSAGAGTGAAAAVPAAAMNELRKLILSMFQAFLMESGCSAAQADASARKIEAALNASISSVTAKNPYSNKARSLLFNLKKNQGLCAHVAAGTITAEQLVSLSAADLASHDQRVLREKLQAQQLQSRRTDWLEENKKTLQADIGIDPNNTWQYDEDDERMSEPDADPPDI